MPFSQVGSFYLTMDAHFFLFEPGAWLWAEINVIKLAFWSRGFSRGMLA
jgi:hypothetical protein